VGAFERVMQVDLSEAAARILSELEEAGAENFSSTVNTITERSGEERELTDSVNGVDQLISLGLAVLRYKDSQKLSKEASLEAISHLPSNVTFDPEERLWKSDNSTPLVEIVATERGRDLAFDILDERGYQWWRQKSEAS
jgi:hypothetical protein